jgi:hypothetical protein
MANRIARRYGRLTTCANLNFGDFFLGSGEKKRHVNGNSLLQD